MEIKSPDGGFCWLVGGNSISLILALGDICDEIGVPGLLGLCVRPT